MPIGLPPLLPFPFPWSVVPTEPPDLPCFTSLRRGGGVSEVPQHMWLKMMPQCADHVELCMMGHGFLKIFLQPLCGPSLVFKVASWDWPVTRGPFPDPPPPCFRGLERTTPRKQKRILHPPCCTFIRPPASQPQTNAGGMCSSFHHNAQVLHIHLQLHPGIRWMCEMGSKLYHRMCQTIWVGWPLPDLCIAAPYSVFPRLCLVFHCFPGLLKGERREAL